MPGSQKLTPPSSANAELASMPAAPIANIDASNAQRIDRSASLIRVTFFTVAPAIWMPSNSVAFDRHRPAGSLGSRVKNDRGDIGVAHNNLNERGRRDTGGPARTTVAEL